MKIFFHSFKCSLLFALLMVVGSIMGQGISLMTTPTASICYNDGSIAAKASGGTSPYLYSIIAGPIHPNLNYPIILPLGSDTFIDLPGGTYTIVVEDAVADRDTFSASVGGSYQFPTLTFNTTSIPGIIAYVSGGNAPYQYAISSTNADSGFSAYQSSDTFSGQCPGQYWVRVIDACSNIYTSAVNFAYSLNVSTRCINYSHGLLTVAASGGHPPYTYNLGGQTNSTGLFTNLPHNFSRSLYVTDSCGIQDVNSYSPPSIQVSQNCTLDSGMYCSINSTGGELWDSLTFICTNCSPPQNELILNPGLGGLILPHVPIGSNYNVVAVNSSCGSDTIQTSFSANGPPSGSPAVYFISCNSIEMSFYPGFNYNPIDSFLLLDSSSTVLAINTTGRFDNIPNGNYNAVVKEIGGCGVQYYYNPISVPSFKSICDQLATDSTCQIGWDIATSPWSNEIYSLVYPPHDTVTQLNYTTNPYTGFFYNLAPDSTYTLISNYGCSEQIRMPSAPIFSSNGAVSNVNCSGASIITYTVSLNDIHPTINYDCSDFQINLFHSGSIIASLPLGHYSYGDQVSVTVTDTGWFKYQIYNVAAEYGSGYLYSRYDSICPLDTGWIYVSNSPIPYPYPDFSYVCQLSNHGDSVPYAIYGGSTPYTVEVLGYDTLSLYANNGIFKAPHQGNYTLLVYDNCGISRSYTFSVIDTCSGCPIADLMPPDTLRCAGDTVYLTNTSLQATNYQWIVNGRVYSTSADTMLIMDVGGDHVVLCAFSRTGCEDSISLHLIDTCDPCFGLSSSVILHNTIVSGDTLHVGSHSHYIAGIYSDTLHNIYGCDSIVIVYLHVDTPSTFAVLFDSVCPGSSLMIGARSYSPPGPYVDTLVNHFGGDSLLTLFVAAYPAARASLYDTVLTGDTLDIGIHSYSQTGVYIDTFSTVHGCDSIVTVYLLVDTPTTYASVYDSICQGSSVTIGLHSYTGAGIHIDTLTNHYGGDSIVTLDLTVYPVSSVSLYDTLVAGDTIHIGQYAHSQTGVYNDTLAGAHGCDSVINLHLYVAPAWTFAHLFDTICEGLSVTVSGHTYTVSGTYIDTLTGHLGGDSIVTLNLAVTSATITSLDDTICQGLGVAVGSTIYTQTGTYLDTLTGRRGCDSLVLLRLTVISPVVPGVTISVRPGHVVEGTETDTFTASYTDCVNPYYAWYEDIIPLGIHTQVAVITFPKGTHDSILCNISCDNGCSTVTSVYSNSIHTGISATIPAIGGVSIYPNPTQGSFTMDINTSATTNKDAEVMIADMVGQSLMNVPLRLHPGDNKEDISLGESATPGVYIVQITVDGQSLYYHIVLEK